MARKITQDLIVKITHPDWAEKRARLVIDDQKNAAVFTARAAPKHELKLHDVDFLRGRLILADEARTVVTFRRIGSSCSWTLARCQIASLASLWPDAPAEPVPEAEPDAPEAPDEVEE